ncbi:MAG: hypothetical protein ABSG12_06710, partial [Steroidobacteraceae bacterium]
MPRRQVPAKPPQRRTTRARKRPRRASAAAAPPAMPGKPLGAGALDDLRAQIDAIDEQLHSWL